MATQLDLNGIPINHFLALPRPSNVASTSTAPGPDVVDTTTVAAHDWDIDTATGFMPPEPPLTRLPPAFEVWETMLEQALASKFQVGDSIFGVSDEQAASAEQWRASISQMPVVSATSLAASEVQLRRAHHVLSFLMHFFIHSQPRLPATVSPLPPLIIPPSIAVPLHFVASELALPLILTYSDNVLYNWYGDATTRQLQCLTLFTSLPDEQHFYLTSAWIELRGVEALSLMQKCLDEVFVADSIALRRITNYLQRLASVIKELTTILDDVRHGCDPAKFYHEIRPWFRGEERDGRRWVFMGEDGEELHTAPNRELSGPSAGQSSLVHALDIFLGVNHTHPHQTPPPPGSDPTFLQRMQSYMPRHHRAFLNHLKETPRPMREFVATHCEAAKPIASAKKLAALKAAFNDAVQAVKEFRDIHIKIATLYIINQAPRGLTRRAGYGENSRGGEKGTGGTDLVPFLKSVRDDTTRTML